MTSRRMIKVSISKRLLILEKLAKSMTGISQEKKVAIYLKSLQSHFRGEGVTEEEVVKNYQNIKEFAPRKHY